MFNPIPTTHCTPPPPPPGKGRGKLCSPPPPPEIRWTQKLNLRSIFDSKRASEIRKSFKKSILKLDLNLVFSAFKATPLDLSFWVHHGIEEVETSSVNHFIKNFKEKVGQIAPPKLVACFYIN